MVINHLLTGMILQVPSYSMDGIGTQKNLLDREGSGFLGYSQFGCPQGWSQK